jgi:hypothetical protein
LKSSSTGLVVSIPAGANFLVLAFVLVWLIVWTYAGLSAFAEAGKPGPQQTFMMFWLIGWVCGEGFAACTLAWQLAGKEELVFRGAHLLHRVSVFGLGRTREFSSAQVRGIRTVPQILSPWHERLLMPPPFGQGYGLIAFDFGAKTYRVGASLQEAEAKEIVAELQKRLPSEAFERASEA